MKMSKEKFGKFIKRIGVRNIIIVSVALLLGTAVYLNYRWFYDPAKDVGYGDKDDDDDSDAVADEDTDYFASASLSRDQARDQAIEVLETAAAAYTEDEQRASTLAQISRIAEDIEKESNIETLIMAKGFQNCVAVINGDKASVIVDNKGEALLGSQAVQISTIVYEQTGILPANISIIPK